MIEAVIGAAGGVAAAVVGGFFVLRARRPRPPGVGIVDVFPTPDTAIEGEPSNVNGGASASTAIGIAVSDIDVIEPPNNIDHPLLDLKLHNRGGEVAFLKRMTVAVEWAHEFNVVGGLMPYGDPSGPLMSVPSAQYDVRLPKAADAANVRVDVGIHQYLNAGEIDHINIRLVTDFNHSDTLVHSLPKTTTVYLLRLHFLYNQDDRKLASRSIAAACPGNYLFVPTPDGLRRGVRRFHEEVERLRSGINRDLGAHGHPAPDWEDRPPRRRSNLPNSYMPSLSGVRVNDDFWWPGRAVDRYMESAQACCQDIINHITPEMPDGLSAAAATARATLQQLPGLREELRPFRMG